MNVPTPFLPNVVRVLAPNPGPFTGPGTNTYVVSTAGRSMIIDPGPVIDRHLVAIDHALADSEPVAVLVTHTHPDHAPAANPLGARLGVPVLGFASGPSFVPTDTLADGDIVEIAPGAGLRVVHTPGHTPDHLCFLAGTVLFSGDHIINGSTVIVDDATAYMGSLVRVRDLAPDHLYPGHGEEMSEAVPAIDAYIAHRIERERQILVAVEAGARGVSEVVEAVYGGLDLRLAEAAALQVVVQLRKLAAEGRITFRPDTLHGVVTLPTMEVR